MYPAPFEYREAGTVDEAISALAETDGKHAELLAGGHGLIPDMKAGETAPDVLIDIGGIGDLQRIEEDADRTVTVGALVTHAELLAADVIGANTPAVRQAAAEVADRQIRNVGTIGGNVAEADPEADLPAALLAADATIHARGGDGRRSIPVDDFFRGPGETALHEDELLTAIDIPPTSVGSYVKRTHPARGYAMVGVAVSLDVDDGRIDGARVAAVGVCERPIRLEGVESALVDAAIDDESAHESAAQGVDLDEADLHGDAYASGEFRAGVLPTYVERAIDQAAQQANGGDRS